MRILGYPAEKISIITTYNGQVRLLILIPYLISPFEAQLLRDVVQRRCADNPLIGMPHKVRMRELAYSMDGYCIIIPSYGGQFRPFFPSRHGENGRDPPHGRFHQSFLLRLRPFPSLHWMVEDWVIQYIFQISTVDKYQGQQNEYVILSLVRTNNIGHVR